MPNLSKDSHPGFIKSQDNSTSKKISLATFLSKQQLPVSLNVAIVQGNKSAKIWILDSFGKLSMRLVNMDLEALAYTFLVNRSYIPASLKLSVTSNRGIKATLSLLPRMGLNSMSASTILYLVGLTRLTGHGDQKQSLESPPY